MMEEENEMLSLRARRKKSPVSLSYSFNQHRQATSFDITDSTFSSTSPQRSPSTWGVKSKTNTLPEIKGKRRSFISRIRRHSSVDLSYNRLNYSLNFEGDDQPSPEDDFRTKKLPSMMTRLFDHHPPRTPRRREDQCPTPKAMVAGNLELRRGFEALSATMNRTNSIKKPPLENKMAAVAEVRKSLELEEVTSPGGISPNRDVLVAM